MIYFRAILYRCLKHRQIIWEQQLFFPEGREYHHILTTNDDAETEIPIVIPKERKNDFVIDRIARVIKRSD
jgi:hypothetical protein